MMPKQPRLLAENSHFCHNSGSFLEFKTFLGKARKLYPMERVFRIHIIKITFFVYIRNIFCWKATNLRRTDTLFITVSLCVFSLYIYAFESKQRRKDGKNKNVLSWSCLVFLLSLSRLLSLLILSLSFTLMSSRTISRFSGLIHRQKGQNK